MRWGREETLSTIVDVNVVVLRSFVLRFFVLFFVLFCVVYVVFFGGYSKENIVSNGGKY